MKNVLLWSSVSSRSELVCLLCWATMSLIFPPVWRDTPYGRVSLTSAFYIIARTYVCVNEQTYFLDFSCVILRSIEVEISHDDVSASSGAKWEFSSNAIKWIFFLAFLSRMVHLNLLLNVAPNQLFYKNVPHNFKEAQSGIQNGV